MNLVSFIFFLTFSRKMFILLLVKINKEENKMTYTENNITYLDNKKHFSFFIELMQDGDEIQTNFGGNVEFTIFKGMGEFTIYKEVFEFFVNERELIDTVDFYETDINNVFNIVN